MSDLTLTRDQQAAYESFVGFICDPEEKVFVLSGYAGTGKSTLVNKLLNDLPATLKTANHLNPGQNKEWTVTLTATTNKAAQALFHITGRSVATVQSALGLIVKMDYQTKSSSLIAKRDASPIHDTILFVDEASYVDSSLLDWIFKMTVNCKVVFIGDPAQLTPVKSGNTPVFAAGFNEATLQEVVRQVKGNPIIDLATAFRDTVNTGSFFQFTPDGHHITHLPRDKFEEQIMGEFDRPDWRHDHSKVLAWTNKTVIAYNQGIRNIVEGVPTLQVGDFAVCNNYISTPKCKLKTDQMVEITGIDPANQQGIQGWYIEMDYSERAFMPASLAEKKALIKEANKQENYKLVHEITSNWIDLRAAYACTINKSQGSTYDRVFIDLDDIKKCNSGNQIARMMYVAVSRARHQVFLTGDLV